MKKNLYAYTYILQIFVNETYNFACSKYYIILFYVHLSIFYPLEIYNPLPKTMAAKY